MAKQGRHIAGSHGAVSVGEGRIERPSVLHTVHSNGYHNSSETPVHHLPPVHSSTAPGRLCNQLVCVLFYHSVITIVHGENVPSQNLYKHSKIQNGGPELRYQTILYWFFLIIRGSAGVEKNGKVPSSSELILCYKILGWSKLNSQKLVGSWPVQPVRWLLLC